MSSHERRSIYDSHHVSSWTTSHFWFIAFGYEKRNPNKFSTSNYLYGVVMLILMGNIGNQKRQGRYQIIITHWVWKSILLVFPHFDDLHYLFNLNVVRSIYAVKHFWYLLQFVVKYHWLSTPSWMSTHIGRQIVFKCVWNSLIDSGFMSDTRINDSSLKMSDFDLGLNLGFELTNTWMEIMIY